MDQGWRSILSGSVEVSALGALIFVLIVSALGIVAGWLYQRQRREQAARLRVEQRLLQAEESRKRADQTLTEGKKAAEALRESEARYRALAVRMSRRHALTAALSQAVTPDGVAQAIVTEGKTLLGAQGGSVMRLIEHRTKLARLYSQGDAIPENGHLLSLESGLCSTETVTTGRPVLVGSFEEWQKRYWRSAPVAGDAGYASAAVLPLFVEGSVWGVLAFHFTAPVNFDEDYQALLTAVAHHCGQALDRARVYEGEQRARTDAEAASRSKDEFLSTVSHELRTPLNAILGWASMLRGGSLDARGTARATQVIYDSAQRQRQLIEDLLDISRMITGRTTLEFQDLDLGSVITSAVESVTPQAEAKGIELRFTRRAAVRIKADARRLEQVFLNLLTNAVKFTSSGGRIDVDEVSTDGRAEVRVSDTGIGIDPAFLPYVFDPFRQADSQATRRVGGLGLGLSIAKQLVDAHEGDIRVESAGPGSGTTFVVILPIVASRTPAAGTVRDSMVEHPDRLPTLEGVRILAVDDEPDAREIIERVFDSCKARVMTAGSAQEALDLLTSNDFDVLLVDIAMPGEDGYTLIRRVRALPSPQKASVPAAALTAYARDDQRQAALTAGFQMHIAKPVDPPQLVRSIAKLLPDGTGPWEAARA